MSVDTILKVRFQFSSVRFLNNRASLMKLESLNRLFTDSAQHASDRGHTSTQLNHMRRSASISDPFPTEP